MERGFLITFEGGEGVGKTTQVELLSGWMSDRNIPHVVTKEPGCANIRECVKIRKLLLSPESDLSNNAELLLFLADRAQHVERFIVPNLNAGNHVICDRFSDSTRVYQCARGLSRTKVDMLLDFATDGLVPDLTFVFDVPVEVGLKRARLKSIYKEGDRLEQAGDRFHEDVRHGFLKLAESIKEQHRFHIINATPPRTIEDIQSEVRTYVSRKLWIDGWEDGRE